MTYDLSKLVKTSKCPVCGVPWSDHDESCSRHAYRPMIRIDANGCDVSELSGLWGEEDTFYYPAEGTSMTTKEKLERLMSEKRVSGPDRTILREFSDFLATRKAYLAAVKEHGKDSPEALALRDAVIAGAS